MNKFRTDTRDIAPKVKTKPDTKPGSVPDNRIPIYDHKGRRRGHVGYRASAATVARFTGQHGSKLGKVDGRDAWISPPPKGPKKQDAKLAASLKAAKGSVSDKPGAPETSVRPKRGKS